MKRALVIILFATSISAFSQALGVPAQDGKAEDSYAIYSLVVQNAVIPSGNTQFLVIAKMTAPEQNPNNACHPVYIGTNPWEKSWNEILSDWNARKDVASVDLERSFNLEKPYLLLNEKEVQEFSAIRSRNLIPPDKPRPAENPRFAGATAMFGLSNVFYNGNRTLALVYVSVSCGPFCGNFGWKVFEKTSSGWRNAFSCALTAA